MSIDHSSYNKLFMGWSSTIHDWALSSPARPPLSPPWPQNPPWPLERFTGFTEKNGETRWKTINGGLSHGFSVWLSSGDRYDVWSFKLHCDIEAHWVRWFTELKDGEFPVPKLSVYQRVWKTHGENWRNKNMKNLTEHLGEHQNYENHGRIRWKFRKIQETVRNTNYEMSRRREKSRKLLENCWKNQVPQCHKPTSICLFPNGWRCMLD